MKNWNEIGINMARVRKVVSCQQTVYLKYLKNCVFASPGFQGELTFLHKKESEL
jgi:hypothetical protein